jgi:hypothetical protein
MALSEPRFVAFVPFLWSVEGTNTPALGLKRFPALYDEAGADAASGFFERGLSIGLEVKERRWRYPNLAWEDTESHPARPAPGIQGEILSIDGQGRIHGRALDRALPHKNLRVQIVVRDRDGRLLHKSKPRRTDLREDLAVPDWPEDGVLLGTHGYLYALPQKLLHRHAGERLRIVQRTLPDGPRGRGVHLASRIFRAPERVTPSPPVRPAD